MGEDRFETSQNIFVVHILAVNRRVGRVVRIIFVGLQAVGYLAVRSSVSGRLEIDPDTGCIVRLEI